MTSEDIAARLRTCSFSVASFDKRFVRDVNERMTTRPLTDKERALLQALAHRYRKQLGACLADGCRACAASALVKS